MCLQCYQSDDSRHIHQRTDESQILFQQWCHLYTRKTTVDREQCSAARQTKQLPIAILHNWLQHFVAYCTQMNQSMLKFFHLCRIHGVWISEVHEKECRRPSRSPIWMYLLDLLHPNFSRSFITVISWVSQLRFFLKACCLSDRSLCSWRWAIIFKHTVFKHLARNTGPGHWTIVTW